VRNADIICVLSQGQLAEQGTHAELMAAGGEYCRLFTLQASGYSSASGAGPRAQPGDQDMVGQVTR
jgi:ATP-binding cassette, subfamily B, bacterial